MSTAAPLLTVDEDRLFDALLSRDRRFDGQFIAGITSTGIYCRPSCPAPVRPLRKNVRFFTTAAAAQRAGLRSCKRCHPDASPGSPTWDVRGDLVGRAMRLIERGEIDRKGVAGVASALHVSERHLHRLLTETVGAGPLALARAQRANLARILLQTSQMPITDVAFASGFSSVRQFNDTIRAVYDRTPTEVRSISGREKKSKKRAAVPAADQSSAVTLTLWLAARWPIDLEWMFGFHCGHGVPGVSSTSADSSGPVGSLCYQRTLSLPIGAGSVTVWTDEELDPERPGLWATFTLENMADLADAIATIRSMFDLDADPQFIADHFASDELLAPIFQLRPGVGVPGAANPFEAAVSAVVGQQISVAGARTLLGRMAEVCNSRTRANELLFPTATQLLDANLEDVGLTTRRTRTLRLLATAVANGEVDLVPGCDRASTRSQLLNISGIGPWTADVIAMRALRDPDVMLQSDLVIKRRLEALGVDVTRTEPWAPWRSYVACTLWATRQAEPSMKEAER